MCFLLFSERSRTCYNQAGVRQPAVEVCTLILSACPTCVSRHPVPLADATRRSKDAPLEVTDLF